MITFGFRLVFSSSMMGSSASSGSSTLARSICFFKSSYASFISVPYLYFSMTMDMFSFDWEDMVSRPLRVLALSSIGLVTSSLTSSGLAPE